MSKRRDIRRNRRRRWIEHQPGIVRPRRDGRIERLGCADPANLDFAGMRSVGVLDQPHQRAVGIDQVADPQAARLQLRSFEARQTRFFPRLPPRSPMPPWHRDRSNPQATAERARSWVEVRIGEEFELQTAALRSSSRDPSNSSQSPASHKNASVTSKSRDGRLGVTWSAMAQRSLSAMRAV